MGHIRSGQSQVVTAVLLGGILVAGIGAAYTWGVPLLQKNQDINTLRNAVDTMRTLADEIESVAQRGGQSEITFQVGKGFLEIKPKDNAIVYSITTNAAYVATGQWVPLNEDDMNGIEEAGLANSYGLLNQDSPGVLIARAEKQGDQYRTVFRLEFRELQNPNTDTGHVIDLVGNGNLDASGGTTTITVTQGESVTVPQGSVTGGPLEKQRVLIQIN